MTNKECLQDNECLVSSFLETLEGEGEGEDQRPAGWLLVSSFLNNE